MLVYDVDSDASEENLRPKQVQKKSPKKQKQAKKPPQDAKNQQPIDKNIVAPDEDGSNTEDAGLTSMTKFRIKKPIDLPDEAHEDKKQKVSFGKDEHEASASGISNLYDVEIVPQNNGGIFNCNCIATILVVDDNEFNLLPLTIMLKSNHKISCVKALNGAEAVKIFARDRAKKCCDKRIQMIMMDLVMPILNGFDATNQIMDILRQERAIAGTYDTSNDAKKPQEMAKEMGVAIAAITAYIDQPTVDKIFDCGMVEAIQKPIKSTRMDDLVSKYYQVPKKSSS